MAGCCVVCGATGWLDRLKHEPGCPVDDPYEFVDIFPVKDPIKMFPNMIYSEEEYQKAISRVGELMSAESGTAEAEELNLLATLISAYEDEQGTIQFLDPPDGNTRAEAEVDKEAE